MNKKLMGYALAWITTITLLSFGGGVSATMPSGYAIRMLVPFDILNSPYRLSCNNTPIATFDTTVLQKFIPNTNLVNGWMLEVERQNANITWNTDASLRDVDYMGHINPKGLEKGKNTGNFYFPYLWDSGELGAIRSRNQYTGFADNGLNEYLSQLGTVDAEFGVNLRWAGTYFFSLNGHLVTTIDNATDHYIYHPILKKLYKFISLSENSDNTLKAKHTYQAWLVECFLKNGGEIVEIDLQVPLRYRAFSSKKARPKFRADMAITHQTKLPPIEKDVNGKWRVIQAEVAKNHPYPPLLIEQEPLTEKERIAQELGTTRVQILEEVLKLLADKPKADQEKIYQIVKTFTESEDPYTQNIGKYMTLSIAPN